MTAAVAAAAAAAVGAAETIHDDRQMLTAVLSITVTSAARDQ